MRSADILTESLFITRRLDDFVPKAHPLHTIRTMANQALAKMDRLFAGMYEADIKGGRPSIAPEKLLRAMQLQVLHSIRSERQLMEQCSNWEDEAGNGRPASEKRSEATRSFPIVEWQRQSPAQGKDVPLLR